MTLEKPIKHLILSCLIIILGVGGWHSASEGVAFKRVPEEQNQLNEYENVKLKDTNSPFPTSIEEGHNSPGKIDQYKMTVVFDPDNHSCLVAGQVQYVNKEDTPLHEIYFHLHPNTFQRRESAPVSLASFDQVYPNGFKPGYIDILSVETEGHKFSYTLEGQHHTLLKVKLRQPLKPNEKIDIGIDFNVVLPPALERFGYGEKTFNFGNWYPIAAVFDEDGWNLDPYYSVGDPFYSDISNYEVVITAPKDMVIASSGDLLSEKVKGEKKTWKIEAKLIRDFAWVASEDFTIEEKNIDGTMVKNYFLSNQPTVNKLAAKAAYDAIRIFNKTFGQYPYRTYSVVSTNFPSGMEYPGIVFIGKANYHIEIVEWLKAMIVHETAHQWWYGVVGSDQIEEAWLDEGLTTYSEVIYYDELFQNGVGEEYFNDSIKASYEKQKNNIPNNENIVKPIYDFQGWADYDALTYKKAAMFIHEIKNQYGEEVLYEIYQTYYHRYKFKNAKTKDFIEVCEGVTGASFDELVSIWLYGK